jgi:hypothetical protein
MHPFAKKFSILVRLGWLAALSVPLQIATAVLPWRFAKISLVASALMMLPCFIFAYVLTVLHWKGRYRGRHSDLWGVLLLLETSGLFKLVYLVRHIVPDIRGGGRYANYGVA